MDELSELKNLVDRIVLQKNKNLVDAECQTDPDMHFSEDHCVGLVAQNGRVIVRCDHRISYCTQEQHSTPERKRSYSVSSTPDNKKKSRKSVSSEVSFDMGDNLSRISPVKDDEIEEVFSDEDECVQKERQCPSCRKVWQKEEVETVFGYSKPDPYGKVRPMLTCTACRKLQRIKNDADVPDDVSRIGTDNRHTVLMRGDEIVCTIRQNGESWEMANHRLIAKYGPEFLSKKKDVLIKALSKALDFELHEGYTLFSHMTNLELLYKTKRVKADSYRTKLKRVVKSH